MTPPIFKLCQQSQCVIDLLGMGADMRLWAFGEAPENPKTPYATWQFISGVPDNMMDCVSHADHITVQIDVYATQQRQSLKITDAIRTAIQNKLYVTNLHNHGRQPKTKLYRTGLDATWWSERHHH